MRLPSFLHWSGLSAVVIISTVVVAASVQAATVTSANDYPSTLQAGQSANHQVVFTTSSGANEGSTIILTFDSNFGTASLTEDDVDISDDGVDLTTAADCSGSEQAGVNIAADVVTITICAGDGGAIAAASSVTIEVGTNATSSGTGSNQATNPSGIGTYFLSLSGAFGDSGSIALPIGGDDSVSVTADAPTRGGSGGAGSGTSTGDVTAPTISSVTVSEVTGSSATVTWVTSELADSAVDYGQTTSFETGTVSSSSLYTSHSLGLSSLSEGVTYYFRVRSSDNNGNAATSSTYSFTTLDETGPVISDIEVVDLTTTTARVTWETDEDADSTVSYGESETYGNTETDDEFTTDHSILLTGLTDGTAYHFQVLSSDASLNQSYSDDETFTTESDDAPTNVSGLSVEEGNESLAVTWVNPDEEDLAGILVLYCEDSYPTGPEDSSCLTGLDDLAESVTLNGLENGTIYYLGVFAYDEAGQFASGALGSGTPRASGEELPSEEGLPEGEEVPEEGSEEETPSVEGGEEVEEGEGAETSEAGSAVTCGDNVCSASESETSCSADCAISESISLGEETGELDRHDVDYLVAESVLTLEATDSGVVDVLPTSTIQVIVPLSELVGEVESLVLSIGSDMYLMSLDEETALYSAIVTTPSDVATYLVSIEATYSDNTKEYVSSFLRVLANGLVYQDIDGEEAPLEGVTVTLFEVIGGKLIVWDGSPYHQFNPLVTDSTGTFAWYVPDGTYVVLTQADGFKESQTELLIITNHIVNPFILMTTSRLPEESDTGITQEPESDQVIAEQTLLGTILQSPFVEAIGQTLESIRELPGVEKAAEISLPTLAFTAGASVVVLSIAFDFLPFLQYLFTAPILFFWRRKRKGYGVVYNAISKTPVDLAVVRLFQLTQEDETQGEPGRLVKSRVTDKGGRYFFLVQPGRYRLTATKASFQFPTEYLHGETVDGSYLDLYHGEIIEVTEKDAVVTANIPLDPSQADKYQAPAAILWRKRLRFTQHLVATLGVVASVGFAVLRPTMFSIGMIGLQVLVYVLAQRLALPHKPISWGIVYDKDTGRPLSRVVARIFEPKYDKLLETQVTDSKGRYAFMLGPNEYYAAFERQGFKPKEIRPIDYSKQSEPQDFSEDVELDPENQT